MSEQGFSRHRAEVLNPTLTPNCNNGQMRRTCLDPQTGARGRKRTQGRLDVRLQATIKTVSGFHSAVLENISREGAKLGVQGRIREGSQVVVQWHGFEAFGTVSWSSPTHCGVILSSEVGESVLHSTLDLNEVLAATDDDAKLAARAWAEGRTRFGFD